MSGRLSRKDLYRQVWAEPISKVAPRLGISDRGLAKICERHRIPRPGRGDWRRLERGYKVRRVPLPPLGSKEKHLEVVWIQRASAPRNSEDNQGVVARRRDFEEQPDNRISVPEKAGRYHPLISQTRQAVTDADPTRRCIRCSEVGGMDLFVDRKHLRRPLLIMDTLFKALDERGFEVGIDEQGRTVTQVHGVVVPIGLEERTRQVEVGPTREDRRNWPYRDWKTYPKTERQGTSELVLRIQSWSGNGRRSWGDGKKQRVEDCLNAVIVRLLEYAEQEKERLAREAERERRRAIAEARRVERNRQVRQARAQAREFEQQAERWKKCQNLQDYVEALRRLVEAHGGLDRHPTLKAWVEWGEKYVAEQDPLEEIREAFLRGPIPRLRAQRVYEQEDEVPAAYSHRQRFPGW